MLKSRADELSRRIDQMRETLGGIEKSMEHLKLDLKSFANDAERLESENIELKKDMEVMEKQHAKEMAQKVA